MGRDGGTGQSLKQKGGWEKEKLILRSRVLDWFVAEIFEEKKMRQTSDGQ